MSAITASRPRRTKTVTAANLANRFGAIPLERIRFVPFPGTATEADVLRIHHEEDRLCELIDGILVEKTMGLRESILACLLSTFLNNFCLPRKLGIVLGADGMMRLSPGLVRIPDVSFISAERLATDRKMMEKAFSDLAPDLAVEVLSPSNTKKEMRQKLADYFLAGVRLVWYVDPRQRTATVYCSITDFAVLTENDTLDGGEVLPGFSLSLKGFFGVERTDE